MGVPFPDRAETYPQCPPSPPGRGSVSDLALQDRHDPAAVASTATLSANQRDSLPPESSSDRLRLGPRTCLAADPDRPYPPGGTRPDRVGRPAGGERKQLISHSPPSSGSGARRSTHLRVDVGWHRRADTLLTSIASGLKRHFKHRSGSIGSYPPFLQRHAILCPTPRHDVRVQRCTLPTGLVVGKRPTPSRASPAT